MNNSNSDVLKRLQELKKQTRNHDVKLKLNLFIRAIELKNVHEACRRMGMGRTFYYKWWGRLMRSDFDLTSLNEYSRRPTKSPRKTPSELEDKVTDLQSLRYGALMIQGMLIRQNIKLSVPTISFIMNGRKHIPKEHRKRLNPHNKRYELPVPGERLQLDVKYVPHKIESKRVYSYVAIDECTRWRFTYSFDSLDQGSTFKFLEMLKQECPFPIVCIQTDNGFEFTYRLIPHLKDHLHLMDKWCTDNKVIHRCIPPGVKELNGKVERSHRIDEQYFYWKATDKCLRAFNEQQAEWIKFYNEQRPHGGLNWLTPVEKLQERLLNLGKEVLPFEKIWIRNQFLEKAPVKIFNKYGKSYKIKLAA